MKKILYVTLISFLYIQFVYADKSVDARQVHSLSIDHTLVGQLVYDEDENPIPGTVSTTIYPDCRVETGSSGPRKPRFEEF